MPSSACKIKEDANSTPTGSTATIRIFKDYKPTTLDKLIFRLVQRIEHPSLAKRLFLPIYATILEAVRFSFQVHCAYQCIVLS